jgi:D-alanyl-D-alanine-carboxypeptidase/D-alanyl-D-alanine-endopeptidase
MPEHETGTIEDSHELFARLIKFSLAVTIATFVVSAQSIPGRAEDLALKQAADMMGWVLLIRSGAPGLVLSVVRGEQSIVLGFGETRPVPRMSGRRWRVA